MWWTASQCPIARGSKRALAVGLQKLQTAPPNAAVPGWSSQKSLSALAFVCLLPLRLRAPLPCFLPTGARAHCGTLSCREDLARAQQQLQAARAQVAKEAADRRALDAELIELRVRSSTSVQAAMTEAIWKVMPQIWHERKQIVVSFLHCLLQLKKLGEVVRLRWHIATHGPGSADPC